MRCNQFCRSKKPQPQHTAHNQREANKKQLPSETIVPHPEATPLPVLSHQDPCQQAPPLDNIVASPQTETIDIMGRPQRQHLNAIGPKPLQSDLRIGGGRHPHPPSASNTKLKHKCPFDGCPWRFATPYKLRRHIKSHTKETPFRCKECGRGFSVRYNLLMHIQTIHSQPQKYKCPIRGCKEAFHTQPRLNGHLRKIHKKEWKTLQTNNAATNKSSNSRASSTSSLESAEPKTPASSQMTKFECPKCQKECMSQSKLTNHMRLHTGEKPFKCSAQGCEKTFVTRERLSKHQDTHKNTKQFSCPHKNCNRVFLRQSHLKNHLKIHTQDHQFVCPVLDCSQKFSSEADYNEHLNTHINYGHRCPHADCKLSFPTPSRLELHCRAVHSNSGAQRRCVPDGISPHLGHPPHPQDTLPASHTIPTEILNFVNEEIIKDVDLPGLTVEDIEAVLSENADWSGEQIEQFLRSAVDLSEIEAKLFSATGYESDSGYSTYDVSPVTSTAPIHLPPGTFPSRSLSPALTPVDPTSFFRCNYSPTNPSFPPSSPHMIHPSLHDSITSPINDANIFSPPQFTAFGPNQDTSYLSTSIFAPLPLSHPSQSLSYSTQPPQDYCSPSLLSTGAYFSENPTTTTTMGGINSPFTDLLAPESTFADDAKPTDLRSNPLACQRTTDGLIHYENFMSSGSQESVVNGGCLLETHSLPNLKNEHEPASLNMPKSPNTAVKSEAVKQVSCSVGGSDSMEPHTSNTEGEPTTIVSSIKTETTATSASGPTQMQATLAPSLQSLPNIPGLSAQLLQTLCSQMPMLSKLLASSSNPAIFLVAITTALSTLTKPLQGATSVNVNSLPGIKSELSKLPPTEVEQLKSQIANLGADQIEKLLSLKADATPSLSSPAPMESNLRSCSQAAPVQGKKPTERTVFARILPTQSNTCPPPTTSVPVSSNHGLQNTPANGQQVGVSHHPKDAAQHRYPIQDSESLGAKQILKGQRARLHKAGNPVAMKPSHKKSKSSQWPRSMNKANLMAFREHILSKLKKGQEEMMYSSSEVNAIATSVTPKVEAPSPSSEYRVKVMCERNRTTMEGFCDRESTELLGSVSKSPMSLQLDHCANSPHDNTAQGNSLEFSDLLFQDDIFSDFHFNPDTLLSSSSLSMDAGVLGMIGGVESEKELNCGSLAHSDLSEELAQILGSNDSPPTPSEQESMEIDCIREFLSDTQNDCKPVPPPNQTHLHVNLQRPCNNASATGSVHYSNAPQQYKHTALTDSDRIAIQTSESLRQCVVNATTYSFPQPSTVHGSLDNFTSEAVLKFHSLDSVLQTQRDPLLADGTCNITEHLDY